MVAAKHFDAWGLSRTALVLSLLLHVFAALSLWRGHLSLRWPEPPLPPVVDVDLVPDTMGKPVPSAKPPPPPPASPRALPDQPQLEEGRLAERSSPAGLTRADSHSTGSGAGTTLKREPARRAGKRVATQTVRDKILAQVLRHWQVPPELRGRDATISLSVEVERDGWLAAPYSARAPWNPAAAIDHYNDWAPGSLQRRVSESLYRALREAQPLTLPPAAMAAAPLTVPLRFRPADIR